MGNRVRRNARWMIAALSLAVVVGWWHGPATVRAEKAPSFDRNAIFLGANGQAVYLVVDMRASSFFGVPAVIGVWTDGTRRLPFAAIPTNNSARWVWLTSGGPAGVLEFHPGQKPAVTWKDNTGKSGAVVTY